MAKKVILGTDIARDAFKTKVNDNFTELYNKDATLEGQLNDLDVNKVDKIQEPLKDATLLNGWVNVASHVGLKYWKDEFDIIHIAGEIKDGVVTSGTAIATLPEGYRPRFITPLTCIKANDASLTTFQMSTNGNLTIFGTYTVGTYRINGSYRAL